MSGGMFSPFHAGAVFRSMLGYAGCAGPAAASYSSVEPSAADAIAAANNSTAVAAEHASSQHDAGQYVDDVWRLLQNTPAIAADQSPPAPASNKTVNLDETTAVAAEHPLPAQADDAASADDAMAASSQHDTRPLLLTNLLLQDTPAVAADQYSPCTPPQKPP